MKAHSLWLLKTLTHPHVFFPLEHRDQEKELADGKNPSARIHALQTDRPPTLAVFSSEKEELAVTREV